ncbi:hypothetical protein ACJX0J_032205, partial [Zea mays]
REWEGRLIKKLKPERFYDELPGYSSFIIKHPRTYFYSVGKRYLHLIFRNCGLGPWH